MSDVVGAGFSRPSGYLNPAAKYWQGRDGSYDMRGANARSAKLTEEQVREIKSAPFTGPDRVSNKFFSRRFGVADSTIRRVREGKTWAHIKVDGFVPIRASWTDSS